MKMTFLLLPLLNLVISAEENVEKKAENILQTLPVEIQICLTGQRQESVFRLEQRQSIDLLPPQMQDLPEERRAESIENPIDFIFMILREQRPRRPNPSWSSPPSGFWHYERPANRPRKFGEEMR